MIGNLVTYDLFRFSDVKYSYFVKVVLTFCLHDRSKLARVVEKQSVGKLHIGLSKLI